MRILAKALVILVVLALTGAACSSADRPVDHFQEALGVSADEVDAKIDEAWEQIFYGSDDAERIYYPVGDDLAYMADINNGDVRSEGISYGMMIAVQLDKQEEFDRLWNWAKTYMYHDSGHHEGFYAWHTNYDGVRLSDNSASDGEIWLTMALLFADRQWGSGDGIYDYAAEANAVMDVMLHTHEVPGAATSIFNPDNNLIAFVPSRGEVSEFSDPSYYVPSFFELWAEWADEDNDKWDAVTEAARTYLPTTEHPDTGLMPDYANFDGTPRQFGNGVHDRFAYDAWRTTAWIALDHAWNGVDPWQVEHTNRVLSFFASQGIDDYRSEYTLDGQPMSEFHGDGLVAMNAVGAALASTIDERDDFIRALWDLPIPTGQYRYYDGLLYFLGLLMVSGRFTVIN